MGRYWKKLPLYEMNKRVHLVETWGTTDKMWVSDTLSLTSRGVTASSPIAPSWQTSRDCLSCWSLLVVCLSVCVVSPLCCVQRNKTWNKCCTPATLLHTSALEFFITRTLLESCACDTVMILEKNLIKHSAFFFRNTKGKLCYLEKTSW